MLFTFVTLTHSHFFLLLVLLFQQKLIKLFNILVEKIDELLPGSVDFSDPSLMTRFDEFIIVIITIY